LQPQPHPALDAREDVAVGIRPPLGQKPPHHRVHQRVSLEEADLLTLETAAAHLEPPRPQPNHHRRAARVLDAGELSPLDDATGGGKRLLLDSDHRGET